MADRLPSRARRRSALTCWAIASLFAATVAGGAIAQPDVAVRKEVVALVPERITFDSLDRGADGAPVRITALVYRPREPSATPRAAVVALHGCGGMYSAAPSRRDDLSLRHRGMAELLIGEGYIVIFPDSFRSRDREEICSVDVRRPSQGRSAPVTVTQAQRRLDVQGALAYLQAQRDVAPDRIAVLGWSHGGGAVLATLDTREPAVAAWNERQHAPYFRAGVAFYPGCVASLRGRMPYALATPLTMFIAGADDWTAPGPCIELVSRLTAAGAPVAITVYPDTYHGFDGPPAQGRQVLDYPNGVHPGKGVTVAPNPAARDDAYAKLRAFLRSELGDSRRGAN